MAHTDLMPVQLMTNHEHESIWQLEAHDLLRGVAGGAIVSMPLLYTMEVWWIGMYIGAWQLLGFLSFALIVNVGLNYASGFREQRGIGIALIESVESVAVAAVVSTVFLAAAGVIEPVGSFADAIGKILLEAIPVSVGVSIANTHFTGKSRISGEEGPKEQQSRQEEDPERARMKVDLLEAGVTVAGSVVFVFNLAPTEEIIMLAARTQWYHWVALVLLALTISYVTIFVADLVGKEKRRASEGLLQQPVPETIVTYVISVTVGMALLAFFGRGEAFTSVTTIVATAAVIGLPASIGGAAGRLLV